MSNVLPPPPWLDYEFKYSVVPPPKGGVKCSLCYDYPVLSSLIAILALEIYIWGYIWLYDFWVRYWQFSPIVWQ